MSIKQIISTAQYIIYASCQYVNRILHDANHLFQLHSYIELFHYNPYQWILTGFFSVFFDLNRSDNIKIIWNNLKVLGFREKILLDCYKKW